MAGRKPVGRLTLREKNNREAETINGGALWEATRGDGTVFRYEQRGDRKGARVLNLSLGDRDMDAAEVLAMIETGDYFVGVIIDDED